MAEVPAPIATARTSSGVPNKTPARLILAGRIVVYSFVIFAILLLIFPGDDNGFFTAIRHQTSMQVNTIGEAMYQYSLAHKGHYPTGKSSTEVFQTLIDEHYISDPTIFYDRWISNDSKTKCPSKVLKPENVSFDVTVPVTADSPDGLPLVFVSGFKITYAKGASAIAPFYSNGQLGGMAAFYKGDRYRVSLFTYLFGLNKLIYKEAMTYKSGDDFQRSIPNFIPTDFDPKGIKYQQLTPDGPLAQ